MTMKEVAEAAYRYAEQLPAELDSGLEATVRFRPTRFPTWSNATHICVVEIDRDTWLPEVERYIVSEDCGQMINPNVVEGQIFGGVVQGLGGVLLEDFVYDDDGNPLTTTFMDYLLPDDHRGARDRDRPHRDGVHRRTPAGSRAWARAARSARTRPWPTRSPTRSRRSASTSSAHPSAPNDIFTV